MPLLTGSVTNRAARLVGIPDILRPLVEDRLREWDKLPPQVQRDLLDNESTVRFYFDLATRTPDQQAQSVTNMSPAMRQQIEDGIQRWQRLSDQQHSEIVQHFSQYFDLTPPEQARTLSTLSEPERAEIDKTLQSFRKLSPAQRGQCLRSFQKLVSFSPADRQEFLKNAERWEQMTPTERESWRNLVSTLSHEPPLPPGPRTPQVPGPPPPNLFHPAARPTSLMTQTN
jgi:flagellar motor switch protein FliG